MTAQQKPPAPIRAGGFALWSAVSAIRSHQHQETPMASDTDRIRRLAFWGMPISVAVLALKLAAWSVTGSLALLSDGLESVVNVVASFIAFFVIRYAQKPADHDHPFGHQKAEYLSAVIEGVLIVVAALLILQQAVGHFSHPVPMDAPALGLAITFVATIINAIWGGVLVSAARLHRSPALMADGQHVLSDVYTSVGVLIGLVLSVATGYPIFDPILAIVVAANILYQGWKVVSHSIGGLMDKAVSLEEEAAIKAAIAANAAGSLGAHDLKTRVAGMVTFIDFHLVVPASMPVGDAHAICDRLEDAIREIHGGSRITIHVEPEGEKAHGIRVKVTREA
jgi:cation diffusion facilitator family transporter